MCLFFELSLKKMFQKYSKGERSGIIDICPVKAAPPDLILTKKKELQSNQKRRRKYEQAAFKAGRLQLSRLKTNLKAQQQRSTCSVFRPVTLARVVHHFNTIMGISLMPMTTSHSDVLDFDYATFSRPLSYFSRCYIYSL